jgi:hypothetical protein
MQRIEAVFGGILALVVLGAAVYLVVRGFAPTTTPPPTIEAPAATTTALVSAEDVLCQCYDQAFALAGSDVGVMSSQYRTGFESCRAVGGPRGGEAWTAGWNARVSARPFAAGCRAWLRRSV